MSEGLGRNTNVGDDDDINIPSLSFITKGEVVQTMVTTNIPEDKNLNPHSDLDLDFKRLRTSGRYSLRI